VKDDIDVDARGVNRFGVSDVSLHRLGPGTPQLWVITTGYDSNGIASSEKRVNQMASEKSTTSGDKRPHMLASEFW
jgi:hypothetical protein